LRAQRYRIARSAIWTAFCVSRRFDVQRDCSIRHSLRTKKQVSVTGTGTYRIQSRLTGTGIRALDFKLLGLKERPPPWLQQEGAFIGVCYAPDSDQIPHRRDGPTTLHRATLVAD
jgi:hypothetical protein